MYELYHGMASETRTSKLFTHKFKFMSLINIAIDSDQM